MLNLTESFIRHVRVAILEKKGQTPYVGDFVEFSADDHSEGYILAIHDRKNSLVRPPIVNIDQAVVIMSAKEPDLMPICWIVFWSY